MQKLYSNILDTIGNTPIVNFEGNLWVKLEYFNPAGSVKDRIADSMLKRAVKRGEIGPDTTIIEPTSGNTGVGLAFCAAALGMKFIAVMPENMSEERKKLIKAYGAELVLTPKELGMQGSVDKANEIARNLKNTYIPMQFENQDNPLAHYETTAEEIWQATDGKIDIFVASMGTGGTISGVGKKLKELKPGLMTVGVEAKESPLLTEGKFGPHKIQGISPNFIPKTLHREYVDSIIDVKGDDAVLVAREAAKKGFLVGISSGATLKAAQDVAKENPEKFIVCVLADNGERYLSGELYE